jgi:hypothetical protein
LDLDKTASNCYAGIRKERAKRERDRKEQILERLRQTGGELVELLREPIQGVRIDHTQSKTLRYIETKRLRRELLTLWSFAEDALPSEQQHAKLKVLREAMDAVLVRPSQERLDQLAALFDDLYCSA